MSPTSSQPLSQESIYNSTADVECLTASTNAEPAVASATDSGCDNNHIVNNSRSCSRCGSINSTKSAIVVAHSDQLANENEFSCGFLNHKSSTDKLQSTLSLHRIKHRPTENLSDDEQQPYYNSGETLSRRSSASHLAHDMISSCGSYTSLSVRSTADGVVIIFPSFHFLWPNG